MKRRDLMRQLRAIATSLDLPMETTEGGSHTKVTIGDRYTVVPRHSEINEMTAKAIIKQIGGNR